MDNIKEYFQQVYSEFDVSLTAVQTKEFIAWNKTFEQFLTGYALVTLNRFYSCTQKNHFGMKEMISCYWNFVRNDEEQT